MKPIQNIFAKNWREYIADQACPECQGSRLRKEARHVFIGDKSISDVTAMAISECLAFFHKP